MVAIRRGIFHSYSALLSLLSFGASNSNENKVKQREQIAKSDVEQILKKVTEYL